MPPIDALLAQIAESAKYRHLCPDTVRRIGLRELAIRGNLKEAVKETKNALHQIAGAYVGERMRYDRWLSELTAFDPATEPERFREFCLHTMGQHASTRERLPYLTDFYAQVFDGLPPMRSVLDVACGLNPLARAWMPLAPDAVYHACDLYADMQHFLTDVFTLSGLPFHGIVRDVVLSPPTETVDLALVLKLLPVLDQQDKNAARTLLHSLNARTILVSFPTRSLGGRGKGMTENYTARFEALLVEENWQVSRFTIANELCFRLTKAGD